MRKQTHGAIYPLLALILLFPALVLAEITEVRIAVDGMTRGHDAAEAQESLSRVKGVDRVEVRTDQAQAIITPKTDFRLDVRKLREALIDAGPTATWLRFEAVGLLTAQDGSPGFKIQGTDQVIPLEVEGKPQELMAAARRDCDLLGIVGIIPRGKETVRLDHFEVWRLSGSRC